LLFKVYFSNSFSDIIIFVIKIIIF
jgi:hypothetical protein